MLRARKKWSSQISRFCDLWLCASNRSPKTIRAYRTDLTQFARWLSSTAGPQSVVRSTIEEWVADLQRQSYACSSIRRKLASLRSFYRYLGATNVVQDSPLDNIHMRLGSVKRLTRVVPWQDITALVHVADRQAKSRLMGRLRGYQRLIRLRNALIIRVLCGTGMRVGELVAIRCDQVHQHARTLVIHGKGNKERLAFIVDEPTGVLLDRYLKQLLRAHKNCVTLFASSSGTPLTTECVRHVLREMGKSAGVSRRITPHMLRHTAATTLLENGADLRIVQEFLGHDSIRSTERYTHVARTHLREVLQRTNPLRKLATCA